MGSASRSRALIATAAAAAASVCFIAGAATAAAPPGATAQCRDGTFSYSLHHSGTCSHHGGVAVWLDQEPATGHGSANPTPHISPAPSIGSTVLLAPRTKTSGCARGPNPDRRCSPGAYYAGLTTSVICTSAFHTRSIRDVPQSEKFQVEREYGMPASYYGRGLEIDHIVPLELGGSNEVANLFPEPGSGAATYHVKDRLENQLHDLVCSGAMTLRDAQQQIAQNWQASYRRAFGSAP
jgi:hypothetical protein